METKDIILELRTKKGLSQEELAEKIFVTRQAVSRWENGETIPNTETLKLLSKLFDVSINTLLGSPRELICQCCGMPLEDSNISKEKDGIFNEEYCKWCYADGEYKLWYHVNTRNKNIHYFSCSNYVKDYRGSCQHRHYVRAEAIEQIVTMELQKLAGYLNHNEDELVEVLTMKTEAIVQNEKRRINSELQRCTSRQNTVNTLYEKLYEDNALGKVTDEWFLHMSQKYGVEREELKAKIQKLHEELDELNDKKSERVAFVEAIRRFIRMETITAPLLHELVDRIEVYETEGTGKNKTQRIVIYYRFVGNIEIPSDKENLKLDMRQGMAVEYLTA